MGTRCTRSKWKRDGFKLGIEMDEGWDRNGRRVHEIGKDEGSLDGHVI
jgi:hypothetical protein